MNLSTIDRMPRWPLVLAMLAVLVWLVSQRFGLPQPQLSAGSPMPASSGFAHWRDARHDWLLVADDRADQLRVYDAGDGRLLQRLDRGAGGIATLAQRDGQLFVVEDNGKLNRLELRNQRLATSIR